MLVILVHPRGEPRHSCNVPRVLCRCRVPALLLVRLPCAAASAGPAARHRGAPHGHCHDGDGGVQTPPVQRGCIRSHTGAVLAALCGRLRLAGSDLVCPTQLSKALELLLFLSQKRLL